MAIKIKKSLAIGASTLLGIAGLSACGGGSGDAGGDTVTIGLVSAFSGPAAAWGPQQKIADTIAIDQINADGGVKIGDKSYKLKLKTYDGAYDPTQSTTVVRQAVQQDGLKFLNVLGGGIVPVVQPITEAAKVIIFGNAAGDSFLGKKYPYTFRPYWDVPAAFNAILTLAKKQHPQLSKVAVLYPDDDLGHPIAPKVQAYAKAAGVDSQVFFVGRDVTDFSAVLTKVRSFNPDLIEVGLQPASQYAAEIKQARQLGIDVPFSFADTVDLATITKVAGPSAAIGSYAAPEWQNFDNDKGQVFQREFTKQYGSFQPWVVQEYDNLFLLRAAMEKAGTVTDTAKIADALGQVSINGALGEVRYGGADVYGLPRIFEMPYPVGVIEKGSDGQPAVQIEYTAPPSES